MKNNDYLYAVASVRALENSLLKQSDLEQLINAHDYNRAASLLSEKGYELDSSNYSAVLDNELEKVWDYISKSAPEAKAMSAFIVKNDFQNLKAILKSEVMNKDASAYFVKPCVYDSEKLYEAVKNRSFDELPDFIKDAAENAFDVIIKTGNGQLCDAVIDTAALGAILAFAKSSGDTVLTEYANSYCLCADIKTAYRAIKTGKNRTFLQSSIAQCNLIKSDDLIEAALEGEEAFSDYLSNSGFSDYKAALEKGTTAFEKYCDDTLLSIIKKAKMTAFGISPLAAYFVAKETEIKCLRIILSAKLSFVSAETIRERMRELYV